MSRPNRPAVISPSPSARPHRAAQVTTRFRHWSLALLFTLTLLPLAALEVRAGDSEPARAAAVGHVPTFELTHLFPGRPIVYAETRDLKRALDQLQDSEFYNSLLTTPQFDRWRNSKDGRKAYAGRTILETYLGTDVWTAGGELVGDRVGLAVMANESSRMPSGMLIVRMADVSTTNRYLDRILPLLELAEIEQLDWDLPETRGWSVRGRLFVGTRGRWVVLASQEQLATFALERCQSESGATVSSELAELTGVVDERVQPARLLTAVADLKAIRQAAAPEIPLQADNAVASLLFGHLAYLARESSHAIVTLDGDADQLALSMSMQGADLATEPWNSFAPAVGNYATPAVPGLVGGISLSRDLAPWYASREELMQERTLPDFDKFETGLANLLPGRDFQHDVLPLFGPRITFLAARQEYEHLDGRPGVQLPAFAVVLEMAQPDEAADLLTLFFQTLSAILNIQAGQAGRQPWVVSSETHQGVQITYARYLQKPSGERLPYVYNFMPASARVGKHFVIGSSRQLCRDVVDVLQSESGLATQPHQGFQLNLHSDTIGTLLADNASALSAQAVRSGRTPDEAQEDLNALQQILQQIESLSLESEYENGRFEIRLNGNWK